MVIWLAVILILNTLAAGIYLLWGLGRIRKKKDPKAFRTRYFLLAGVIFFCPLVGLCFLGISGLLFRLFSRRQVDMADVSFDRKKNKIYSVADVERDINMDRCVGKRVVPRSQNEIVDFIILEFA